MPIEHPDEHFHQYRPHTADTHAQGVGPQEHHAPDLLVAVGVAGAGAVAEDQVGAELGAHVVGHSYGGKITEAGGDAVGHPLFGGDLLRQGPGALHGLQRLGRKHDPGAVAGHRNKLLQGQAVTVDGDLNNIFGFQHSIASLL